MIDKLYDWNRSNNHQATSWRVGYFKHQQIQSSKFNSYRLVLQKLVMWMREVK